MSGATVVVDFLTVGRIGVDETDIKASKDFSLDKDIIRIVSVGHIEKYKGQSDIVSKHSASLPK